MTASGSEYDLQKKLLTKGQASPQKEVLYSDSVYSIQLVFTPYNDIAYKNTYARIQEFLQKFFIYCPILMSFLWYMEYYI